MRQTLLLLFSLLLFSPPVSAKPPTAGELLDRAIAYHDPEGRFLTRPHRLAFLETRPGGTDRRTEGSGGYPPRLG